MHLVNAIAPVHPERAPEAARCCARPARDKHIVNVSAMEGQFYRTTKTDKHPHTNMAKAALNMMTRTSAPDFVKDGIHMNAVDTGWVTDEDPAAHAARKAELGFAPPLDIIDGAARIVDPIFCRPSAPGEHVGTVPQGLPARSLVSRGLTERHLGRARSGRCPGARRGAPGPRYTAASPSAPA